MSLIVPSSWILEVWFKIQSLLFPPMEACNPSKRTNPIKLHSVGYGFYCIYLWNPRIIAKNIWKEGSPFSMQKLGWNMLKQITKQRLSPNAPLQEVIKRIFISCRSSLWAKDPSWSSPKFCNPRLRMMSHPLSARLTWKSKGIQNICYMWVLNFSVDLRMWQGLN